MAKHKESLLWSDRKRICGLPISFTKYKIESEGERLYVKKGFLKSSVNELLMYRILDVKTTQSFWQLICGVGTVHLFCADKSDKELLLVNIKDAFGVHKTISELAEKAREKAGIVGKEIIGAADDCNC